MLTLIVSSPSHSNHTITWFWDRSSYLFIKTFKKLDFCILMFYFCRIYFKFVEQNATSKCRGTNHEVPLEDWECFHEGFLNGYANKINTLPLTLLNLTNIETLFLAYNELTFLIIFEFRLKYYYVIANTVFNK